MRRCLEYAYESSRAEDGDGEAKTNHDMDSSIYREAEAALRDPFAQSFLISILNQRCKF